MIKSSLPAGLTMRSANVRAVMTLWVATQTCRGLSAPKSSESLRLWCNGHVGLRAVGAGLRRAFRGAKSRSASGRRRSADRGGLRGGLTPNPLFESRSANSSSGSHWARPADRQSGFFRDSRPANRRADLQAVGAGLRNGAPVCER